jgi:hypothetical protein
LASFGKNDFFASRPRLHIVVPADPLPEPRPIHAPNAERQLPTASSPVKEQPIQYIVNGYISQLQNTDEKLAHPQAAVV